MTIVKTIIRSSLIAGALLTLMMTSISASAASACKGLETSACESSTSCRWVQSYKRKDGREVNAFCRSYSAKVNVNKSNSLRQKSSAVVNKKASAKTLAVSGQ